MRKFLLLILTALFITSCTTEQEKPSKIFNTIDNASTNRDNGDKSLDSLGIIKKPSFTVKIGSKSIDFYEGKTEELYTIPITKLDPNWILLNKDYLDQFTMNTYHTIYLKKIQDSDTGNKKKVAQWLKDNDRFIDKIKSYPNLEEGHRLSKDEEDDYYDDDLIEAKITMTYGDLVQKIKTFTKIDLDSANPNFQKYISLKIVNNQCEPKLQDYESDDSCFSVSFLLSLKKVHGNSKINNNTPIALFRFKDTKNKSTHIFIEGVGVYNFSQNPTTT